MRPPGTSLRCRVARRADVPALRAVMDAAITQLQREFLDERQIASSRAIMGIDTRLIDDGTYFVVTAPDGALAGCGGWSRRGTLFGNDGSPGRDDALLDPAREPARVRAMYTAPAHARRGVGRLILDRCERAAAAEGFTRLELMATASGFPLYVACGFQVVEHVVLPAGGVPVPGARMAKEIGPVSRRGPGPSSGKDRATPSDDDRGATTGG